MKTISTKDQINAINMSKIAHNAMMDKAKIVSVQYAKGYAELKIRNGLFAVVELKDEVTAEVRIPFLGGFKSIISIYGVSELIDKLSN